METVKRLVLGDIHGHYEHVINIYEKEQPDEVILLGDYVDSFSQKPEDHKKTLETILELQSKHAHGKFKILLGNHDYHYIMAGERYSGFYPATEKLVSGIIRKAVKEKRIVPVYVDWTNKYIYSHGGVTNTWMREWNIESLGDINDKELIAFRFTFGNRFSYLGDTVYSSPIWVRPGSLAVDGFRDKDGYTWTQVVGHTPVKDLTKLYKGMPNSDYNCDVPMWLCDALPKQYLVQTLDENGVIIAEEVKKYMDLPESYRQ